MSHCSVCVATTIFPDNLIFFQDFLDGLYYQTYKDFDIILYNDGCNEDELTKKLDGFNFDIISTPSINSIAQIRHYIFEYLRKKNYEIIFFGDSDDFFNENRIAKSLEMHLTGSDIVFNDLNLVDQKSKLIIKNYWACVLLVEYQNPRGSIYGHRRFLTWLDYFLMQFLWLLRIRC